ncbi:MAG: MFS transporter [Deltaproteobacteria bacterium]|nr:MFS transporter [Deltaproteobacteria bacterium]
MMGWLKKIAPLGLLLVVVAIVFSRLPKVKGMDHLTPEFSARRLMNWLPLGLTYSFMYMGRYNLKVSKHAFETMAAPDGSALMGNADFGMIFGIGTAIYGVSFLINGPLTDRIGGRKAVLGGTAGVIAVNALMGVASWSLLTHGVGSHFIGANFVTVFSVLYAFNMYFQSFGAVSVVKVNAPWFHVRERGVFGAIFGILISLGLYFAYDWSFLILENIGLAWVFLVPAIILTLFLILDILLVRDRPGLAGQADFNTGDATSGDGDGPQLGAVEVFKLMIRNPIIITIALVEFSSGFLRQAIMQWYRTFASQTNAVLGLTDSFVYENWGLLLCVAGILGGMVAGIISDRVFQSRRGPVAVLLYGVMLISAVVMTFTYTTPLVSFLVIFMTMAVIGVHGMLSGTASMDFGGARNVGVAVGIIDGFVYLGTAVMSFTYAIILPDEELDAAGHLVGAATDPANWLWWPVSMIPVALFGTYMASRLWNATPKGSSAGH